MERLCEQSLINYFVLKISSSLESTHQLNCPQKLFSPLVVLHHVRQREVILLDVVTQFRIDLQTGLTESSGEGT